MILKIVKIVVKNVIIIRGWVCTYLRVIKHAIIIFKNTTKTYDTTILSQVI